MKINKVKLILVLFGVLSLSILQAQETNSSSGGNAKGNEGSISYSVGQIVYCSHKATSCSLTQGVQQAYEISSVKEAEALIELECSIYPNPTFDILTFKLLDPGYEDLSLSLWHMTGKLISNKDVVSNETKFNMKNLSAGIYFLRVVLKELSDSREIRVFKIVKN